MDLPSDSTVFGIMLGNRYEEGEGLPMLILECGVSGISVSSELIEECSTKRAYVILAVAGGHQYITSFVLDADEIAKFGFVGTIKKKTTSALNSIAETIRVRVGGSRQ